MYISIGGHNWRKAVARDWYANGVPLTVKGKIEIFQQSEYEITNIEVHVKGLIANSGYHVHVVSRFPYFFNRDFIFFYLIN